MRNLLIYGTSKSFTPALLDQARLAALRAYRLVAREWQIVTSDRYGLDAEVARTCTRWGIPLVVCGLAARPRNGVSLRHYERVLACPVGITAENLLNRYMMTLADNVVVLGDSPDCWAMRLWAKLCGKLVEPGAAVGAPSAAATTRQTSDIPVTPRVIVPMDRQIATRRFLTVQ